MLRYLAVGHVCKDKMPGGWVLGGTLTYASRTAQALGCAVSAATSCGTDLDLDAALPNIAVTYVPAPATTTFENLYTPDGRQQWLHARANDLNADLIDHLQQPVDILHLAPVAQEVDPGWLDAFDGALTGVTPQGWLRHWNSSGRVTAIEWAAAGHILQRADATIISIEDVNGDEAIVECWAAQAQLLVVTRGRKGCTLYVAGDPIDLPAPIEREIDPTGAGDIFAAAFFVRLKQTGEPVTAARFANCIAARSVTRRGLDGLPTPRELRHCQALT